MTSGNKGSWLQISAVRANVDSARRAQHQKLLDDSFEQQGSSEDENEKELRQVSGQVLRQSKPEDQLLTETTETLDLPQLVAGDQELNGSSELLSFAQNEIQDSDDEEPKDPLTFEEFFQEEQRSEHITAFFEVPSSNIVQAEEVAEEGVQDNSSL